MKDEKMFSLRDSVLNMIFHFLKMMECDDIVDTLQTNELIGFEQHKLKLILRKKYQHVWEGISKQGESTILNQIYTDLYITEGGAGTINQEHEMRQIQKQKTRVTKEATEMQQERQIDCKNMFEPLPGQDKDIRMVMTQGVAGIGKSICVQKFVLDWATDKKYQDIKLLFPLPFRELNLKKENRSLRDLISEFFPETKGLRFTDRYKVMFIFDGLDECRFPLAFQKNKTLTDASIPATLDVILTSLIKGDLLPSALIWITTRPAAAARIPAECVVRVTEVRGFNDQQKEEYFRKRISDESLANKIIKHIKASRSLFIMCHIPVFCWISATVFEKILKETEDGETPKTLTEMYTCFLIFQTIQGNLKYTGKNSSDIPWDKEAILALGKLAFYNLEKSNLIFYAEDLEECGIDVSKISVYSGLCTQETSRFHDTVFSFVHLSIQEFIASLYAYMCLRNENVNVFDQESTSSENPENKAMELLRTAVDKALESDSGHLDLFLRFLLGLTVDYNQKLIRGLLKSSGRSSDCQKEIAQYIKMKFDENPSPERSINLFYCLNELNDDTLVKEIQSYLSSGRLSETELSPAQWFALVFVLLTSDEDLDVFDLQKFIRSDECFRRLLPVVKESKRALLSSCNLTDRSCSALLTVLNSESNLIEVDLSNNDLQDSGIELISSGLKNQNSKLEILSLRNCNITAKSCADLKSALDVNTSHLKDLDLSNNQLGDSGINEDSGVKKLSDLLKDPHCRPTTLRLSQCNLTDEGCLALFQVLSSDSFTVSELDLSNNQIQDSGVRLISDLLNNPNCKLHTVGLSQCNMTDKGCSALFQVLSSDSSTVRKLDLSNNQIQDSGVRLISDLLKNPNCKLLSVRLSDCGVREEGYAAMAEALKSNPSSELMELDLRGNHPGDSGVKLLYDLLQDPNCKLKTLRILKSPEAEEVYTSLCSTLGQNPLILTQMKLERNPVGVSGDSRVKLLSAFLQDSHCKLQKLQINDDDLTMESCSALSEVLRSGSSSLRELDLSNNNLQNSGVQKLCEGLKKKECKLEVLRLSDCGVREEGYAALAEALKSNPSSELMELDLRGNHPGDSGVKLLDNLLQDPNCKLKTLRLLKSPRAEEVYTSLYSTLGQNPLILTQMKLERNPEGVSGDSRVKLLSEFLQDSHCKLQKLQINDDDLTMESCSALSEVLRSGSSSLRELDLSNNNLQNSGVKKLCEGLKKKECKLEVLRLSDCGVREEGYAALAEALKSNPSSELMELDLRGNHPGDSGVKLLDDLVQNKKSKLSTLRFLKSPEAEEVYTSLCSTLGQNPLILTQMKLERNPEGVSGDSRVKLLSAFLQDSHCKLQKLQINDDDLTTESCSALSEVLRSGSSSLRELDLSNNNLQNSGVQKLCEGLKKKECKLEVLRLSDCGVGEEGYAALAEALKSNRSYMKELDLRGNHPGESGMQKICDVCNAGWFNWSEMKLRLFKIPDAEEAYTTLNQILGKNILLQKELDLSSKTLKEIKVNHLSALLGDPHCTIQNLTLRDCEISDEGYVALAGALMLNPSSHLTDLDLSGNNPGTEGMGMFNDLLKKPNSKLKVRFLSRSPEMNKACDYLNKMDIKMLDLVELDLSGRNIGDSGVKHLSTVLKDPHCMITELTLRNCSITDKSCADLKSALDVNPSHLKDLDLSNNQLGDPGVIQISHLLKNPQIKLHKLILSDCGVREEGYAALAEALKSNPSSELMELDLRGNHPGDSGVKLLDDLVQNKKSKLSTLRINDDDLTMESCSALSEVLRSGSSSLRELDLSNNNLQNSGVQKLCEGLKKKECKLEVLRLSDCGVGEEGYAALAEALKLNRSYMKELDLRGNHPGESGVQKICSVCKAVWFNRSEIKLRI
ncbi:NLR family CARD domain-containing protein 3-like [Trichomycterus rosablanca]|uniref:NLR family CARD domain-containing protein 3-like n=1 Tax=Trichomycterus rosablanca TaxID=2290929 RepID=UPI002F3517F1